MVKPNKRRHLVVGVYHLNKLFADLSFSLFSLCVCVHTQKRENKDALDPSLITVAWQLFPLCPTHLSTYSLILLLFFLSPSPLCVCVVHENLFGRVEHETKEEVFLSEGLLSLSGGVWEKRKKFLKKKEKKKCSRFQQLIRQFPSRYIWEREKIPSPFLELLFLHTHRCLISTYSLDGTRRPHLCWFNDYRYLIYDGDI